MKTPVVILGLGFSGRRLAERLVARNVEVAGITRDAARFADLKSKGAELRSFSEIPTGAALVHTIPPLIGSEEERIHSAIRNSAPRRIVYISSTGVYGSEDTVNENTLALPNDEKGRQRLEEERWLSGIAPTLVLRSAAIYGPFRGVHVRLREGKLPRGTGVVSRIHVDDLAAHLEAGVTSELQGAWPVADEKAAASEEVMNWCAAMMGLQRPDESAPGFPVAGRAVDGRKIRELLGIHLQFPSYREGIIASIQEEGEIKKEPPR